MILERYLEENKIKNSIEHNNNNSNSSNLKNIIKKSQKRASLEVK
jgi:hypothetical protein